MNLDPSDVHIAALKAGYRCTSGGNTGCVYAKDINRINTKMGDGLVTEIAVSKIVFDPEVKDVWWRYKETPRRVITLEEIGVVT